MFLSYTLRIGNEIQIQTLQTLYKHIHPSPTSINKLKISVPTYIKMGENIKTISITYQNKSNNFK